MISRADERDRRKPLEERGFVREVVFKTEKARQKKMNRSSHRYDLFYFLWLCNSIGLFCLGLVFYLVKRNL